MNEINQMNQISVRLISKDRRVIGLKSKKAGKGWQGVTGKMADIISEMAI